MKPELINHLAVFVAAFSAFGLGAIWYSGLLFGKAWMEENGFTQESITAKGGQGRIFGLAFLCTLVMAYNLAAFLAADGTTLAWGATAGLLAGLGWIAMGFFLVGLFERKSLRYLLINAGYLIVALVLMGVIIGAWR